MELARILNFIALFLFLGAFLIRVLPLTETIKKNMWCMGIIVGWLFLIASLILLLRNI
jgi:hypothetical protein